jgi:hypothetical protein
MTDVVTYSSPARPAKDLSLRKVRSALTNGSALFLGNVDERAPWCRRLRDLSRSYQADCGNVLSEGQRTLVKRAALLTLQLELMESNFAKNNGEASPQQIDCYQRVCNTLRRLLESLEIHKGRVARDVTPTLEAYVSEVADGPKLSGRKNG